MTDAILNGAVIGLGVGEQHAKTLLDHANARLAAICDLNHDKITSFLQKHSLDQSIVKTFDDILKDPTIDLVVIASFDDIHYDQVMRCLMHKKQVFVEKPVCQTVTQLHDIYRLLKKQKLAFASNLILRKAPLYGWLERSIANGEFGSLYALDMDYLYGRIDKITHGWRSQVDHYSVMTGGGIHMIDLMMQLANQKPATVTAVANKIATRATAFKYDDFHTATFCFNDQLIGRINANFGCVHKHQHVVRLFGTKATFIYDDMGPRIYRDHFEDSPAEMINLNPKVANKGALLLDFIETILSNRSNQLPQHEFDLMCAVFAANSAIDSLTPIQIAYFN